MRALWYIAQILGIALAFFLVLLGLDWVAGSVVGQVLAWVFWLVGPALALRWALK
jgi:hypothetical protein